MIAKFVARFMAQKEALVEQYMTIPPSGYEGIVKDVVRIISDPEEYDDPDPERIHRIDDGDYQGTLVFVIAAKGYQPYKYWYTVVSYGSCSGCDTFEGIRDDAADAAAKQYGDLALHVLQGLKKMGEPGDTE